MGDGTGACGINCLTCGLFRRGKCGPCASGTEEQARQKLAVQLGVLGGTCAILQCAVERRVSYCSADCDEYPCERYLSGPYPLSRGYLEMQMRRRSQSAAPPRPTGDKPSKLH
jgi:hypothetical protein